MCTPTVVAGALGAKEAYDTVQDLRNGPPAPPQPATMPTPQSPEQLSAETQAAVTAQREQASKYYGQQATIMTSPLGLSTKAKTSAKKLLGG